MKFLFSHLSRISNLFFTKSPSVEIYTDGSSKDGVGSWAFIIQNRNGYVEKSGRVRCAHSNAMEFQAAIEAFSSVPENSKIALYSDSKVLIDAMNFRKKPKVFQTQIDTLIQLSQKHQVTWNWVKAHNGNKWNERCDELCTMARISGLKL